MFPDLEFIKTCLNGLRSKFDKLAQDTNGKLQASTADWNQNDPDALDYVKGRTHYEANGKVVQLPPKFLPSPTSNTAGAIKADVAKTTDIQPVRLGTDGKLYSSGIPVFTASETLGVYSATVPEITKLVNGMLVVMIPNKDSTSQYPRLTINGGSKINITRPVSTGGKSSFISLPNLKSGLPYLLIYTGSEWLSINNVRPDAFDLTNFVSPINGGTGRTNLTKGSYIIGNGLSSVRQKTPSEVLADIGAIPAPATASVGQAIVVKAVDENGKPTEWAPVTLPDKLPNPNALTFSGAVEGSYDGSKPLTVDIPSGGGGENSFVLVDTYDMSTGAISYETTGLSINEILLVIDTEPTVAGQVLHINGTTVSFHAKTVNSAVWLRKIVSGVFQEIEPRGYTDALGLTMAVPIPGDKIETIKVTFSSATSGIIKIYGR